MTKVELTGQEDRQALKNEIKAEIRRDNRRRKLFGCGGCLLLELLLLAVPVVFSAVIVAKTGWFEVPIFSAWLYQPAQPVRHVAPLAGRTSDQVARIAAAGAKQDETTGLVKLRFTENELTTFARDWLAASGGSLPVSVKSLQIAVDPDAAEVFAVISRPARDVTVKASFLPSVEAGQVKFACRGLRLGALDVPTVLGGFLTSALERILTDAAANLKTAGELADVELRPGAVEISIAPKPLSR